MSEPKFDPCAICGRPAKRIYNEKGQCIQMGIHKVCWDKASEELALKRKVREAINSGPENS
jgi:hypothetical protein